MRDTFAPRLLVVRQSELSWNSAIRPARAKDLVSYGNWMPVFYRSSTMHLSRRLCPYAPSRPRIPFVSSAPAALPTHETDVAPWRLTGFATAEPGSTEASRAPARARFPRNLGGPRAGELNVEPSEAATLHDAVSRLARGETAMRICREWNAAGAQTSRGARWRPQTLRRTLLSDHLTGARGYPRLLSDEEAAVARSALASEERRAGRPSGRRAPLVGFVYCGECGGKMTTGGGAYRCSVSHGGCGGTSVKMEPLNEYVVIQAAKRWKPRATRRPAGTQETRALIEELRRLETRSDEIADGLASGILTVRMAGEATRRVEQRRRELTEQLSHAMPAPQARLTIQPGDWDAAVAAWQSLALEGGPGQGPSWRAQRQCGRRPRDADEDPSATCDDQIENRLVPCIG
jgi:hypothetical protein